jgi:spore germination protein KC
MRKNIFLFCLLILCSLLCGCWDRREINELGLVVGLAIDYTELEGGKTGVKFTAQVANPSVMAGGQSGITGAGGTSGGGEASGSKAFWTVTETGETIRGAIAKMNYGIPKQLFFGHTRVHIYGEKASRAGLAPFLDRLVRSRESRENNFIAVAKGDPSRILELESSIFQSTALALNDIFRDKDGWQAIMAVNHADFDYRLSTGITCPIAPVVEIVPQSSLSSEQRKTGGNTDTISVSGLAAFDQDGRLVDYFNERETLGLLWILNRANRQVITIPHFADGTEESISLRQVDAKSKIVVSIGEDGLPGFEIKTQASFDVLEHFGSQRGLSDVDFINNLEIMACSQIINEIEAAVTKSQQINTDVFGFGEEVRRQHRRDWPQYKDHWREIFPAVKVTVECKTHIHDKDLTVEPPGSRKEGAGQ